MTETKPHDVESSNSELQIILEELSKQPEIEPSTYDASYEMARKASELYYRRFPIDVDQSDLDLFYYLVVDAKNDTRRNKIAVSSLDDDSKAELMLALSETEKKEYQHYSPTGNYGMFRRAIGTFNKKNSVSKDNARKIVRLFADLSENRSSDEKIGLVRKAFAIPIKGFQNGVASQILHCIEPTIFPIINGHEGRNSLFCLLNIGGIPQNTGMRNDLTRYADYCSAIRSYRDDESKHFAFKNYRVFDIQEAELPQIRRRGYREHPFERATISQMGTALYECMEEKMIGFIEEEARKPNIFAIFNASTTEIRHSYFLAWLFDPTQTHNLQDVFLRQLLKLIQDGATPERALALDRILTSDEIDLSDAVVKREEGFIVDHEKGSIDILITSKNAGLALLIENKAFTGEHDNQLERYKNYAEEHFPEMTKVYVYLTPSGKESSDPNNWQSLDYGSLIDSIDLIRDEKREVMSEDAEVILRHYSCNVKAHFLNEGDLKNLCRDFYMRHRLAIDVIKQYAYDPIEVVLDNIERWLDDRRDYDDLGHIDREGDRLVLYSAEEDDLPLYEIAVDDSETICKPIEETKRSDDVAVTASTADLYRDSITLQNFMWRVNEMLQKVNDCSAKQ